jgi:hypothetical protein
MTYKTCHKCKTRKPLALFYALFRTPDLHDNICKDCRIKSANPLKKERKKDREWLKQFSPV